MGHFLLVIVDPWVLSCFRRQAVLCWAVPSAFPAHCFALPQLLKEAVESQRMCELMKQQETHLKQQVSCLLCLLSFVGGFPSLPEQPKVPSSGPEGQDPSWVWFW